MSRIYGFGCYIIAGLEMYYLKTLGLSFSERLIVLTGLIALYGLSKGEEHG